MAIISIARECCSHGAEIAEKVADMLGYECISREILLEAAYFFNIPEQKLRRCQFRPAASGPAKNKSGPESGDRTNHQTHSRCKRSRV